MRGAEFPQYFARGAQRFWWRVRGAAEPRDSERERRLAALVLQFERRTVFGEELDDSGEPLSDGAEQRGLTRLIRLVHIGLQRQRHLHREQCIRLVVMRIGRGLCWR